MLAGSAAHLSIGDAFSNGFINTVDIRVLAALSRTTPFGRRWHMRLSLGAGIMSTRATGALDGEQIEAHGVFPTAEASALFARELGSGWAFAAGPIVNWYSQTYKLDSDRGMTTLSRRDLEVMAFGGIRRRL